MNNHIKLLSWKEKQRCTKYLTMLGSRIMHLGLPWIYLPNSVFLAHQCSPPPVPALAEHRNTEEALFRAVGCLLLTLKLFLGLCSAKDLSHLPATRCLLFSLLLSLPQSTQQACVCHGARQRLTAGSVQPSLQKGYGLWVGVIGIL